MNKKVLSEGHPMTTLKFRLCLVSVLTLAAANVAAGPLWSEETHDIAFGNFNLDGRTDMLFVAKDPAQTSGIVLSSATSALDTPHQTWPSNYLGIPWHSGTYKPIVSDFSGDGRDDILLQRQTPGDHYLLVADATGQFTSIKQTIPNNTGGQLWSADSHRIIAGDFNGDGKKDLFLQSVAANGLHAVFLADSTGTFGSAQQTWADGQFGFAWSLSKANVYAGDFTGDGKADLFVQGKPTIVIIDFDIPFPVPSYRAGSFGIMQAKVLSGNDIFYMPAFDTWDRMGKGGDWSGANYRAVVADFDGDGRADVFLQGNSSNFPNRLVLAATSGQLTSTDSLVDPTLRAYSSQQGRIHAANFDATGGFGVYLQAVSAGGTNQYAHVATSSTVTLLAHYSPAVSTPTAQTYLAFTAVARYNVGGQLTGTIAPDPDGPSGPLLYAAMRNSYDTAGRLVKVETGELNSWFNENVEPKDWTGFTVFSTKEIEYDQYGRVTKKFAKGSDGVRFAAVHTNYNSIGQPLCKAVRMNPSAFGSMPADACQLGAEGVHGPDRIAKSTYDQFDQLITEKRGVGTVLEQTYVTNTYSGHFLTSQTDANDNFTKLEPDNYWRLYRRYYPSKTTPGSHDTNDYNEYFYDANGNVTSERKRSGATIGYTYDALNRPRFKNLSVNTHSQDVNYNYDLRGLNLYTRFAADGADQDESGLGLTNEYNGFGRLWKAHNTLSGTDRVLEYEYDSNGNRATIKHPDAAFFAYKYDDLNRVREIKESDSTSLIKIEYDSAGRRKNITRMAAGATTNYHYEVTGRLDYFNQDLQGSADDLTNTFTYSSAGQITQLVQSNSLYAYSGSSNRVGSYVPNGLNQIATLAAQPISYDSNGNLTSDGPFGATYDLENRLVATTGPTSTLKYDPLGRLYEYTVAGTPSQTTQLLYDGDAAVIEYNGTGGAAPIARRFVHRTKVDEPLIQYDGSNLTTRRFLHADHLGSVIALSDNSGGVVARNTYDVFGVPSSSNAGLFGYTGQIWLRSLDLNYYKARIYHPRLGRFLQTDPIGYKDDLNLYAYTYNDPLNRTDPNGLYACGANMDSRQCNSFQNAQDSAIKTLEKNLPGLRSLSTRLGTGVQLSKSEQRLLARVEKYAPGSGTASGVKAIADRGDNMLGALKDKTTMVAENISQNPNNPDARANSGYSTALTDDGTQGQFQNTIFLQPAFYRRDRPVSQRGREIAHETDHQVNRGVDKAYVQDPGIFQLSPNDAANNPDSVVGALGFPDP